MKPADFPDPADRKLRVLEELPVAPRIEPKPPTKEEIKALKKKDHQHLNALKIQLQPIMDQINRRYRKFRQPVIPQSHIDYLFAESDPNYVRPDVTEGTHRPFEIVKDKHGHDVLRDTITGKTYYNLETTTIEERLSNGFYARPRDFLFDIRALAKDAKNIGDKERTLKANELLSNVEVDVAGIEASTANIVDWEALHRRQLQRAAESAEKERKRKAMQSVLDRVTADLGGGNDSDSQGPLTLGERVPGSMTAARFQVRSPLSNGNDGAAQEPGSVRQDTNAMAVTTDGDVQMSEIEESTQAVAQPSVMGPPAKMEDGATNTGMTQISQKSAITSLPPGVSPSAVANDASTTRTSDPSTHRSSNFSTQLTNGHAPEQHSSDQNHASGGNDADMPDTLVQPSQATPSQATPSQATPSQATPSDKPWPHSQAQGLAQGNRAPGSILTSSPISPQSQARVNSGAGSGSDPVHPSPQDGSSARQSGSSSQPMAIDRDVEVLIHEASSKTNGFTIEQLEQVNREIMDELWKLRSEWNRGKVLNSVQRVFNDTVHDIEATQLLASSSQI